MTNIDGSNQVNLTNNPSHEYSPAWSPDGNHIAFTSTLDGSQEIYSMNADGSNPTKLTNGQEDDQPAWSPDGKQIAFMSKRDGIKGIYIMNADGSNQVRLTNDSVDNENPAWQPAAPQTDAISSNTDTAQKYLHIVGLSPDPKTDAKLSSGDPNSVTVTVEYHLPDNLPYKFGDLKFAVWLQPYLDSSCLKSDDANVGKTAGSANASSLTRRSGAIILDSQSTTQGVKFVAVRAHILDFPTHNIIVSDYSAASGCFQVVQ